MFHSMTDAIHETGIYQYGFISPSEATFYDWVRDMCKDNKCGMYAATWACPPAVGTLDACRERCLQYDTMMIFSGLFSLNGPFDFEGMKKGVSGFKPMVRKLDDLIGPLVGNRLVLSNEGCDTCERCTYPDAPCRFPDRLYHSMEGYGLVISDLAKKAGVKYNNGEGTMTFFGAILFNRNR